MPQAQVLTDQQIRRVIAVATQTRHADRNVLAIQLSFLSGLRAKEIAALTIGHVVDQSNSIRDHILLTAGQTKGSSGRTVVISDRLQKALSAYLVKYDLPSINHNKPLLPSQKGGHFSGLTMVMLFRSLFDAAGLDAAKSHSGRRTFITKLANTGINARVIQALAGHKNLQTTQRYIEINDQLLANAVNSI